MIEYLLVIKLDKVFLVVQWPLEYKLLVEIDVASIRDAGDGANLEKSGIGRASIDSL